ncbi:hypothetical protein GCM10022295_90890 [Streptomyces osmaniensis]|uniref:Uncharacterized protein n=1 Tax=Streptomyces osmaniensis TaxID=593134 RepID=A0ABP6Z1X0_9ACTN
MPVGEADRCEEQQKDPGDLEAYDLTGSYRAVAELAGGDHHTMARYEQAQQVRAAAESWREVRPRTRMRGVSPWRAQALAVGGVIEKPASSSKTIQAPRAAAALPPGPGLLHRAADRFFVAFHCASGVGTWQEKSCRISSLRMP